MSNYFHAIYGHGGAPAEDLSPVLLWENSNLDSFAEKKIDLDLTNYDGCIVEFKYASSLDWLCSRIYVKKTDTLNNGNKYFGGGVYSDVTSYVGGIARGIKLVDNTGITFTENGYLSTKDNVNNIPYRIYGVKEYVVEEVQPVTKDLLWTNPSPTSEFGAVGQTNYVEADLTNYEYVLVEYRKSTTDATTSFFMNKVSDLPSTTNGNQNGLGSSGSGYGICRPVSKNSSNKLGFEGAFAGQTPALNACIPVKVYGINGLAV